MHRRTTTLLCLGFLKLATIFVASLALPNLQAQVIFGAPTARPEVSLKELFKEQFSMGCEYTARRKPQAFHRGLYEHHFEAIHFTNSSGRNVLEAEEGIYNFADLEASIAHARSLGAKTIIAGPLVGVGSQPTWLNRKIADEKPDAEALLADMQTYITKVMRHFEGQVDYWIVINDTIITSAADETYYPSRFYKTYGEEGVPNAFRFAREADPKAKLMLSEAAWWYLPKIEKFIDFLQKLQKSGIQMDALGLSLQLDYTKDDNISYYKPEQFFQGVKKLNLDCMVIEMDVSVYDAGDYKTQYPTLDKVPNKVIEEQANLYLRLFRSLHQHHEQISHVFMGGLYDAYSYRNSYPVVGRPDYATLFDRQLKPKVNFSLLVEEYKK